MPMTASVLSGTPFCQMKASKTYLKPSAGAETGTSAGVKVGKDVLDKLQSDIEELVSEW